METYVKKFPNKSLAQTDAAHIKREIEKRGYKFVREEITVKQISETTAEYTLKISYK